MAMQAVLNSHENKNFKIHLREPVSCLTHFAAFLASIPVTAVLVYKALEQGDAVKTFSFIIFGASLLLLYGASALYHGKNAEPKTIEFLRRIDHMMIFVLIAGTYTPVCLVNLSASCGKILLYVIWGMATAGILVKIFWLNAPRFLSTSFYVIMGWAAVFAFYPLSKAVPMSGIILLILGGVTYTIGAVIYALKKPGMQFGCFGFHEIFHLFVMGGSLFHIVFMFLYVL